tara:strand:+ start:593 stop:1084 length:492 start_codon:yes stop_codon:yes gene_type:complete
MKKLFSLLGINQSAEVPGRDDAIKMIAGSPEDIAEAFEAGRNEINKLRGDKEYIENRLRSDIDALRQDRADITQQLEEKVAQIAQLQKEVTLAKDSAAEKAREMLRGAGHAPVAEANTDPDAGTGILSAEQKVLHDYNNMAPGADRLAFATKHRAELEKAANQ